MDEFKGYEDFKLKWNETKQLINIYGIASAMSYLHSNNIIHRELNLDNVFLDDNLYPKLFGFYNYIDISQNSSNKKYYTLKNYPKYLSPEIPSQMKYSKSSDVYSFAILMCEILNNKDTIGNRIEFTKIIQNGNNEIQMPILNNNVADCYRNLIHRCLAQNPEDRPTFNDIVNEIKTNKEFITEGIDSEEFNKYIKFIDESERSFSEHKSNQNLYEALKNYILTFDKTKIDLELRGPSFTGDDLNLTKYKLETFQIIEKHGYKLQEVLLKDEKVYTFEEKINLFNESDTKKKIHFCSHIYSKEIHDFSQHEIVNFVRKLSILSRINHPAIINFVGYSPIDFDNKNKPVIFTEHCNNISSRLLLNPTRILMIIYGIASAMSYLHSHGIIHRDLKISNIFIDEHDLPKLGGFDISKEVDDELDVEYHKIKGTPRFLAPEIYMNQEYSKASDVYSFGFIMYQLITENIPFYDINNPKDLKHIICDEEKRPEFKSFICKAFRDLIEKCWSQDPKSRPSFDEILKELRTNEELFSEDVVSKDYYEYIKFIDEFQTTFDESKRINYYDEVILSKLHTFTIEEPYPDLKDMEDTEKNDLSFNYDFFDLSKFQTSRFIKGQLYEIDKIYNESEIYVKKHLATSLHFYSKSEIYTMIREMTIVSQLNHPSILKYIGYNPDDKIFIPHVIMEYSPNGSLYDFFEKDSEKFPDMTNDLKWNDTKKLIYFYGIASGMAYLHSHNIIHRDLKPGNIFLDKNLYPKISGFNISKELGKKDVLISTNMKGTPAYLAPEIYLNKEYSKSSDVYSFGLIMYEILSGEKPFINVLSPKEMKRIVCDEASRPPIPETICESYRNLIERCWSQEPESRPTFEMIVTELKTNLNFITQDIDEDEFHKYIQYIDETPNSFNPRLNYVEHSMKSAVIENKERNLKVNLGNIYKTELNNIQVEYDFIDIKKYKKEKLLNIDHSDKIYKISDKQTGAFYQAKKRCIDISLFDQSLCNDINYNLEVNHPSFLRLFGYSLVDFKGNDKLMIITDYATNGTLENILEIDMKNQDRNPNELILNPTKRLIILYGIASGMSYLHSHDIIHCSLNPSHVYLDEFLFPRITEFNESELISENPIPNIKDLPIDHPIYSDIYDPPELVLFTRFCSANDVYSFSIIAYQLITNENPFEKSQIALEQIYEHGFRPQFSEDIPVRYKQLIEKCWSFDPKERPTFDEIVYHLKTNPDFITESINKEEFESYVKLLDEFQINRNSMILDDFIKTQAFRKVELDFKKLRNTSRLNFTVNMGSVDLDKFEKVSKIGSGSFGNVYKVLDKETENFYAAKVSIYEIDQCTNDTIINISREIDIISKLNHPSILQFIGFNPKNFKNKPKPIIITELASNYSLDKIIQNQRLGFGDKNWDDTKKLINIYGIASGMAYLHRLNILHRDLKPGNILLDEFLYPKIADFGLSKVLYGEDEIENSRKHPITSGFKGTYAYCAPEIISQHKYSKSGDVYAYGMIVYEIITNEIIFKDFNRFKLGLEIVNGYRPEFKFPIPYCFRKLIERCWSGDCETRPSFNEIVELLETNSRFITPNVDKDEYHDYISYIKESFPSNPILNQSGKIDVNSNTLSSTPSSAKPAKKHSINLKIIESEKNELNKNDECFLDLTKFERKEIINKNDSSKIYKFKEIETGQIFAGQMSMIKIGQISKTEIDELKKELNDISKLKHPCLLKFYGYSPIDFKKQPKPVIITEYFSNGSLSNILELERNQQPIEQWNFTKKLINLYGIASCMSYLHSNGIIHKTLNPNNIFLDDILTPKIGDFGLSSKFEPSESITVQSISGIKATPIYLSPEILLNNEYSKMSDVYAFGMIAYEMICNEIPFKEIENHNQIFHEVVNNQKRPYIKDNIPLSYVKLIEECWSQDMNERPTFDDIVYRLKVDKGFITEYIDSDDYHKYIKFIEEQLELASHERIDECENNTGPTLIKKVEVNTSINETEVNTTYEKNHILFINKIEPENKLNEGEEINIEHLENLAIKYISSNDSENIYRILNILIQNRSTRIAVNYAISLYKAKQYQVSFNYFRILSKHNHPIAKYFIGIMKFRGQGCEENRSESYEILKYLSDNGIDRATVFLEEYFSK